MKILLVLALIASTSVFAANEAGTFSWDQVSPCDDSVIVPSQAIWCLKISRSVGPKDLVNENIKTVIFPLIGGTTLKIDGHIDNSTQFPDALFWVGDFDNKFFNHAVITVYKTAMIGDVQIGAKFYRLTHTKLTDETGERAFMELDPTKFPPDTRHN